MKYLFYCLMIVCLLAGMTSAIAQIPITSLHGDEKYSYSGLHSGNQIRCNFYNDGMVGRRYVNPTDIGGEWPINMGHDYMNQMIMFVDK